MQFTRIIIDIHKFINLYFCKVYVDVNTFRSEFHIKNSKLKRYTYIVYYKVLKDSKNNHESNNQMSLEFDIQRYLDVSITSSFDDNYYFGLKDAIPITLNVESFIFIKSYCIHNIHHIFRLPVKTEIKWKIKGGTDNGAFKIGGGIDAEYFARDYGDSVIFYPQLKNISKDTTYKNISIYLTINQVGSSLFKEQEYKFIVNVNMLLIRKFLKRNYQSKDVCK